MSTEQITADDIRDRPHPKKMDTGEIQAESGELVEPFQDTYGGDLYDAITRRWSQMHTVLNRRLDIDYPECPECGADDSWAREIGAWVVCMACDSTPPEDVAEDVKDGLAELWGSQREESDERS